MIYRSKSQEKLDSPTAFQQEQIEGSVTGKKKVPAYVNYNKADRINVDVAMALLARDASGFGTSNETSNGVIEY